MKVLGIETSTYSAGAAVVDGDRVLGELFLDVGPKHAEKLVSSLDWLLKEVGMERGEIQGVAVSVGPGSFTALRVGISTAKGLAFSLGIPVVGISSLEVLARNLPFASTSVCPIVDAKKREVFAAFFKSSGGVLNRDSDDMLLSPERVCDVVHEKTVFLGSGALLYRDVLKSNLGELALFCPPNLGFPRASNCAFLGAQRLRDGLEDDLSLLAPLYLRKAEAETLKERVIR